MVSVVRKCQPGITRVLPHAQNRKYAKPEAWGGDVILTGDSWASRIPSRLHSGLGYTWRDEGISGATIYDKTAGSCLLNTIDAALAAHPDASHVLVYTGGINDMLRKADGTTVIDLAFLQAGAVELTDKIVAAGMTPIMCDIPVSSSYGVGALADETRDLCRVWSDRLSEFCKENQFQFIPLLDLFCDDFEILEQYRAVGGTDPTHINDDGYHITEQQIARALKANTCGGEGVAPPPPVDTGFRFDGTSNSQFRADLFDIDPSTDRYIIEVDCVLEDPLGVNRDIWGTVDQASYFRARGLNFDMRVSYGAVANNATNITWNVGQRSVWRSDNSVINQMTVSTSGQTDTVVTGSAAGSSLFELGGRTGGAVIIGTIYSCTVYDSDGVTVIERWPIDEGSGNTFTGINGNVLTQVAPGGGWV